MSDAKSIDQDAISRAEKEWVTSPEHLNQINASLGILCKDIGAKINRLYPKWWWVISPDEQGGIITIFSQRITMCYGYIIKIEDIQNDPERKEAMRGCGEILERYGMPLKAFDYDCYTRLELIRGLDGEPQMDITDFDKRKRDKERDETLTRGIQNGNVLLDVKDVPQEDGSAIRHIAIGIKGEE